VPVCREAAEFVRQGGLGKVTAARAFHIQNEWPTGIGNPPDEVPPVGFDWNAWQGPAPQRRYNKNRTFYRFRWFYDYSGGQVTNFGVHYLDFIQWALGLNAPETVTALGGKVAGLKDNREIPDTLEAIWQYPGGTLVTFSQFNATAAPWSLPGCEVEIRGTLGTLYLVGNGYEVVPDAISDDEIPARSPLNRQQDGQYRKNAKARLEPRKVQATSTSDTAPHARNFLDCVKSRAPCNCDIEIGHRSTSATLLANIALKTRAVLDWDAKTETFPHHAEANKLLSFILVGLLTLFLHSQICCVAAPAATVVTSPPNSSAKPLYPANRAPLTPSPFIKLPIGSITPKGWLRSQLQLEADGMTGHLEEISQWCKFEDSAWASPTGQGKFGWEELPYWLKGFGDLGYVLKDEKIIARARRWVDAVLAGQESDGYFGPRASKTSLEGHPDLWPHMVMLNVLQSFYEFSGDPRVLPFMSRYLQWLNAQPPETFGRGYWPKMRWGDTIESAQWLYNRTGEPWLLDLGRKIHQNMARWDSGVINWHNVNIAQGFREPAIYYQQAHDPVFLQDAERNYETVMDRYGQFPGGAFAGDENCRPGYTGPRQGFETCGIVEFMHSFELLTRLSGNPLWAERCEELAFNSLPAALTPDAKALHYLTCANQIQLDQTNKSPAIENRGIMFSYSPYAVFRCCQHNVSHGWPYYSEELWLATPDHGLCASLYSASEVTAKVGSGTTVTIAETTDYPFAETIEFSISASRSAKFPLYFRLPRWARDPSLELNGQPVALAAKPLAYAVLDRTWKNGDHVRLRLPMHISVRRWEKNSNAASVDYGPLTFSLKIGERYARYGGSDAWPEFEVFPTTPWSYGLVLDAHEPANSFELVKKPGPWSPNPFTPDTVPLELYARAKKIPAWTQDAQGLVGKLQPSPVKSSEPEERITLIPMGAARLRITSFPVIGDGSDAHEWTASSP
jgi:DUF1680 family protein/predicted dehydrogenase